MTRAVQNSARSVDSRLGVSLRHCEVSKPAECPPDSGGQFGCTQRYQYPSAENLFWTLWRKEISDFRKDQESHYDWIPVEPVELFWTGVVIDRPYNGYPRKRSTSTSCFRTL
jgi:hypothetical protein